MLQAACLSVIKDPNVRTLICASCLSKDRVLHSLQVLPHLLSICNAVTGITLTMQDKICWECKAQLLKMLKFREKAVRSQRMLTSLSPLIQEHRSGQEGGIVESLSTLSQNEPLYYEVGINIPAQEQTTQVLVNPTEEMIANTPPAIVTVELETPKIECLEEVGTSSNDKIRKSLVDLGGLMGQSQSQRSLFNYDESESAPRPDNEGNGLETQAKVGVEGITLNTIDEYDESESVPRPLKLDPHFDNEGSSLETQVKDDVEGITLNTIDEQQNVQESACVLLPFKSELASDSEQSSSVDSDSESSDRKATDKDNVEETTNSSDEGEMMKIIKSHQKNSQDYLDIADVVSDRAAPDVPTALGFFKEEHIDLDDAETLTETEEMRECILNKINGTDSGLKTEEEMNADIRMSTETDGGSPAGDIREESSRWLELEKLKEQVASWRVMLHRLPTDAPPPSGGAVKKNVATGYSEPEKHEKIYKMGLHESINKVDGSSATDSCHVDQLRVTSEAKKKKYKHATKSMKLMTIETNFELNAAKSFICEHCQKSFVTKFKLRQHISTHNWPLQSESMGTGSSRLKIRRTHTGDKPYKCKTCDFNSAHPSSLQRHMRTHTGEKPYKCKTCDYKSVRSSDLQKHMRTHTGEKPYKCKTCDFKSAQSNDLKRHMGKHTGEKPYECVTCDYKSARLFHLKIHLRTHTGEKPYKCKTCDFKSAQSNDLKIHMRKHTGEKPYKCRMCDYKSAVSCKVKIHMRTHTGEKPYKCKMCDFKSAQSSDLTIHIRTHTGEKPYKCKTCNYKCAQLSPLKKHMRTHTGEKPYECNTCDFKSAQLCDLKKHMRKHMGENRGLPINP